MSAYGNAVPNDPPRIIRCPKTPEDKRLAQAALTYGEQSYERIAQFMEISVPIIQERLRSPEFQTLLAHYRENPNELLPDRAELIAKLSIESATGDRSTDRQRAVELLLEIQGKQRKKGTLDQYRKKKSD